MKQIKYECKYGKTSTRKCLVPFSGNGRNICRLYETGQCKYDAKGNKIDEMKEGKR
jgi:hypothetical protein